MSIIRNPDPASLSWTYNPAKIVSLTLRHSLEDAIGGGLMSLT